MLSLSIPPFLSYPAMERSWLLCTVLQDGAIDFPDSIRRQRFDRMEGGRYIDPRQPRQHKCSERLGFERLLLARHDESDGHFAEIGIEAVDDSFGDGTPLAKNVLTELSIEPAAIEEWIARRRQSVTEDVREAA